MITSKTMTWPIGYTMPNGQKRGDSPESSSAGVELEERPGSVVAVLKFSDPTTEQFVRCVQSLLLITNDIGCACVAFVCVALAREVPRLAIGACEVRLCSTTLLCIVTLLVHSSTQRHSIAIDLS